MSSGYSPSKLVGTLLLLLVATVLFHSGCGPSAIGNPEVDTTAIPTDLPVPTPIIEITPTLLSLLPTSTPHFDPPPSPYEACPGDYPSELRAGMPATVGLDSANVRSQPGNNQPVVAGLPAGTLITIIDGPECFEGQTWWQITTNSLPGSGWVFEADLGRAFISPVQSTGSISGKLEYPGGNPPAMRVLALHLSGDIKDGYYGYDQSAFFTDLESGQSNFTITNLPNGFYWIIAVPLDGGGTRMGGYTKRSECLVSGKSCEDHDLIPIPLHQGESKGGIVIADWSSRDDFPPLVYFAFLN